MIRDFFFLNTKNNNKLFSIILLILFFSFLFFLLSKFFFCVNITNGLDFSVSTDNEDSIVIIAENFELLLNSVFSFFDFLIIFILFFFGFCAKKFFLK